jgi:hypothetical protein
MTDVGDIVRCCEWLQGSDDCIDIANHGFFQISAVKHVAHRLGRSGNSRDSLNGDRHGKCGMLNVFHCWRYCYHCLRRPVAEAISSNPGAAPEHGLDAKLRKGLHARAWS